MVLPKQDRETTTDLWTGGVEYDEIEVVRWVPGVLPGIAHALGFDPQTVRDLPEWLKFPVNVTAGTIIQPAFDFLAQMARARGKRARETCAAYAYDLRAFFEFMAYHNLQWHEANQAVIDAFVFSMACAGASGDDDERETSGGSAMSIGLESIDLSLSRATIKRRVAAIHSFYSHARPGVPVFDKRLAGRVGRRPDDLVRPIPPERLPAFLWGLGPRPSHWTGLGTSRLWCCCMLALTAGLRRIEVCGLDVDQIRRLRVNSREPYREYPITLDVTKGGARRVALLPCWLVEELQIFISNERAVPKGVVRIGDPLFVNHRHARRSRLSRISPATITSDFRNAMLAANMRRMKPAFRYGTGASERLHTFHDLRHTCACLHYMTFSESKNPWIEVQTRLGHRVQKTTVDVYLRFINEMQDQPIDLRQSLVHGMLAS
ncbi:tyrosine-type recombinase/integrase [Sphingomonas sp. Leaf205]|uniref:tyrosine-type recombinase/integrase n=1 Tax=Sphingomonas sp. Leaf205 TaxID=2876551 RepID=UPI001E3FB081|nr:tyrosine-type recombinase/integrase [Sphingomonas sp. Leaf205]